MKWRWLMALCCSICLAQQAHAQTNSSDARAATLQQLQPGIRLRLQADGERNIGRLRAISADSVFLEDGAFALRDLEGAWIRQRSTRKGTIIGALVGAPAGGAFGLFVIWLADALCESSCGGLGAGELVLGTAAFSAFGLLSGGAVGAVIGAGIPRWGEVTDKRTRIPADPEAPIGSFSISPAYAQLAQSETGGGFGGRAAYTFETKNLALGLEAGSYNGGTTRHAVFQNCPDLTACIDTADIKTTVFHAGGIARVVPGGQRGIKPFASLGVGVYSWSSGTSGSLVLAGYSLGAGAQLRNRTGRRGLFAEARWQSNLSRSGDPLARYGFYSIGVGSTIAW